MSTIANLFNSVIGMLKLTYSKQKINRYLGCWPRLLRAMRIR